ncbi:MAG: hypothetical protein ACSLE6_01660 [Mycobacterium sp.]
MAANPDEHHRACSDGADTAKTGARRIGVILAIAVSVVRFMVHAAYPFGGRRKTPGRAAQFPDVMTRKAARRGGGLRCDLGVG